MSRQVKQPGGPSAEEVSILETVACMIQLARRTEDDAKLQAGYSTIRETIRKSEQIQRQTGWDAACTMLAGQTR